MKGRIHVGVDARCLNAAHVRGMGRYVSEIVSRLAGSEEFLFTLFGDRLDLKFHIPVARRIRADVFEMRGYRFHAWEQIGFPYKARRAEVGLMHCTASTAPFWQPVPAVLTLHDTLYWEDSGVSVDNGIYLNRIVPAAIRKCRAIITISQQSKRDIGSLWPMLTEKLHVVPHGVSDSYLNGGNMELPVKLRQMIGGRRYLLYLGGRVSRKRFGWAVNVLEGLDCREVSLVACGFSKEEVSLAAEELPESLRERVKFPDFVAEEDMPALYRHAICVLYPTLYEGFGFPVVESQAVGTPVVFSAVGSLQELQGPGTRVLPVDDLAAWISVVNELVSQRVTSGVQDGSAKVWARRHSWDESAKRHAEVYRSALVLS